MQGQVTALYLKGVTARRSAAVAPAPRSSRRMVAGLAATAAPVVVALGAMAFFG
jgi:hypothetical protein